MVKNETPNYVEFSNDSKFIASGVYGAVRVWDVASKEFRDFKTKVRNETPKFISFAPNDTLIAAGVFGAVRIWNIHTNEFRDYPANVKNETPLSVTFSQMASILLPEFSEMFVFGI